MTDREAGQDALMGAQLEGLPSQPDRASPLR